MVAGRTTSPALSENAYLGRRVRLLLLVVEPQAAQAQTLKNTFDKQFNLVLAMNAADGLLAAGEYQPDVVLAAADLDDIPSASLVSTLRRHRPLSVIIGAGPQDGVAAAAAMQAGAAACVARPYQIPELEPVVRSLQPARTILGPVVCGPVRLDPDSQRAFVHDRVIDLPPQECDLLHLLMSHCDQVLSRDQIRRQLWPGQPDERSNTLTVHIRRLRLRLGDDPWNPTLIATVRGRGYRFTATGDSRSGGSAPLS